MGGPSHPTASHPQSSLPDLSGLRALSLHSQSLRTAFRLDENNGKEV